MTTSWLRDGMAMLSKASEMRKKVSVGQLTFLSISVTSLQATQSDSNLVVERRHGPSESSVREV